MFDINKYLKTTDTFNYGNINENFYNLSKEIVFTFFSDKTMFKKENFKFFYYDDYVFNTNTSKSNYITLYIEIDQPLNEKNFQDKKFDKKIKDKKIKNMHLPLKDIKEGLYSEYIKNFDSSTVLWQDKYGIIISYNEEVDGTMINYQFRVIPCFKYLNEFNIEGIIYYDDDFNFIEIEYPLLSIQHILKKDEQTNGLYYTYLIALKNMFMIQKKVENLTFEVFETILYNVPNNIFEDESSKTLTKIINYLRNVNFKEVKTIDEQDYAFTSKYKSFSLMYAKHVINQLESYIKRII